MITRKIQQIDASRFICLPNQICEILGLEKGQRLSIAVESGKIVIAPIPTPRRQEIGAASSKSETST